MNNHATETDEQPTDGSADVPWWSRDRVAVVVLVCLTFSMWFIRRRGPAMNMEEAMMLQAPLRVLGGSVQGRDFDYFYGPVSLWFPAVIYKGFAPTLLVERAVGAIYLGIVGVALAFVGRRWSILVGIVMGAIAVLVGALSITALPIYGSIGFLVAALAFALSDLAERPRAWAIGLTLAVSVGLRPDFALWATVLLVTLTLLGAARLRSWVAFGVGCITYVILILQAGWSATWRTLVSDGLHVSAERRLPFELNVADRGVFVVISGVVIVAALVLGLRRRNDRRGIALIGLGVIGLCLVPEYLQRADGLHVVYVTMVPLATMVPVLFECVEFSPRAMSNRWRHVAVFAVSALLLFGIQPKFIARSTLRDLRFAAQGGIVYAAHNQGGEWYFKTARDARAHTRLAAAATRIRRPGDVLFVGPLDLSWTTFSDGSFYTLLPHYLQRTRFYDFHPRVALVDGVRLAADVRAADVLVLCDVGFHEDNLSGLRGSPQANRVVRTDFVEITREAGCRLYRARSESRGRGS